MVPLGQQCIPSLQTNTSNTGEKYNEEKETEEENTVTSSLNEISTDQLEIGWGEGGKALLCSPPRDPFLQQASGQIQKT
jgi:hypothetical protein